MQNINNISYINISKVININSEVLFREAEDDFYYFNKINLAYKKLKQAVKLTPSHKKSLVLAGNICFIKGHLKKALHFYLEADKFSSPNCKIYSLICNCYFSMQNYKKALEYSNMALELLEEEDLELYYQLLELRVSIFYKLKEYKKAYAILTKIKKRINLIPDNNFYVTNSELLIEKIKLQKKIKTFGLQII